jgi:two-component system, cell cycle response regulator
VANARTKVLPFPLMPAARILVVDYSPVTVEALGALLRREGFEVVVAADGAEAVRRAGTESVDLLFLAAELPGLDGLEALRLIRAGQARRYLPVFVLCATEDRKKRVTALELGADDFLLKPWDDPELLARVRRSLAVSARFDALVGETADLHQKAITDGLTQVYNRRFFEERLKEEFRRAQRYDDPLSLVLLDLDEFKSINDRFGHQEGDRVLRDVAAVMRKSIRDTDVVARYGGEEFALLLPKTPLAGALTVAERVWKDVAVLKAGAPPVRITGSLGVSGFPNRSVSSPEQLFRTADDALYRAKRDGRNKICLHQQPGLFAPGTQSVS